MERKLDSKNKKVIILALIIVIVIAFLTLNLLPSDTEPVSLHIQKSLIPK